MENKDLIALNSSQELQQRLDMSNILAKAEVLPKRFRDKPGNVLAVIQAGHEIGLPPMVSIRSFYLTENNELTMMAELMLGIVMNQPEFVGKEERFDKETSTYYFKIKRKLQSGNIDETEASFSLQDAKNAGLLHKDNWRKYPERMMRARAMSFACRGSFPDRLAGIYSREELDVNQSFEDDRSELPTKQEELEQQRATPDRNEIPNVNAELSNNSQPEPERKETVVKPHIAGNIQEEVEHEVARFNKFMEMQFADRDDYMAEHVKLYELGVRNESDLKKLKTITGKAVNAYIKSRRNADDVRELTLIALRELDIDAVDFLYRKKPSQLIDEIPVDVIQRYANAKAKKLVGLGKLPENQWDTMRESLEKEPTRKNWLDTIHVLNDIAKQ